MITWLLERGYQVTGKFKSSGRVRKLVGAVTTWSPTSSPGREVAPVPKPVTFVRPLQQYAVRTPSKDQERGLLPGGGLHQPHRTLDDGGRGAL